MQAPQSAFKRTLIFLAVFFGCQFDAVAATGVTACDTAIETVSAPSIKLVDYDGERRDDPAELLKAPASIDSSALPLTSRVDTTVLRNDHVKDDLELPVKENLDADPDAAAILLERRNSRLREATDDNAVEMNTKLPGMDADEMLQFRQQMYRTDI